MKKLYLSVAVTIMVSICSNTIALSNNNQWMQPVLAPPQLEDGWRVGTIKTASLDENRMIELSDALAEGRYNRIQAVLVEHQGTLVYEYYAATTPNAAGNAFDATSLHPVYSITKSVTSMLLGTMLKPPFEAALTKPLHTFFPTRAPGPDPRSRSITLQHVLTMTSGHVWNEMDVPYTNSTNDDNVMHRQPDPVGFVLNRPLREKPGERWYYSGGMAMLIAEIVDASTPGTFLDYARDTLLTPLGISQFGWDGEWKTNTLVNAGWGLRMSARELAKIGSLVLHNGKWKGTQIVPSDWLALSTQRLREDLDTWSADGIYGYGFQWWHGEFASGAVQFEAITALGSGGQRVFVVPERNLVVTVFADNYSGDWLLPEEILKQIIASQTL